MDTPPGKEKHRKRRVSERGDAGIVLGLALAAGAFAVLSFAAGKPDFWSVAVPGTLTGVGTIGLAVATFATLRNQHAQDAKRDEVEKQRVWQQRRAQAARVQVSEPIGVVAERPFEYDADGFRIQEEQVDFFNQSDDAISSCRLLWIVEPESVRRDNIGRLTAMDQRLLAKQSRGEVPLYLQKAMHLDSEQVWPTITVWLLFRDSAGVTWARDPDHELIEITAEKADELFSRVAAGETISRDDV